MTARLQLNRQIIKVQLNSKQAHEYYENILASWIRRRGVGRANERAKCLNKVTLRLGEEQTAVPAALPTLLKDAHFSACWWEARLDGCWVPPPA